MSDKNVANGRRRFLKTTALAGGAATVALAAGEVVAESEQPEAALQQKTSNSKGYHVTPHIEAYYRLARD